MKVRKLENVEPKEVFKYFEDLTFIPRNSGNEEAVANYLADFAREHGYDYSRDEMNNVIIRKPASKGYENHPGIILQGHTDMVCQKVDGSDVNFDTDPIEFEIEDGKIIAKETSLGADDGIGIAFGLAILADKTLKHPAIEFVCTTDEERGFFGIEKLDCSSLTGTRIINLDHGNDQEFCIGSAGTPGLRSTLPVEKLEAEKDLIWKKVSIQGLVGGHSGEDIEKGRANAIKLMGRILLGAENTISYNLGSIAGGTQDNAIPRASEAVICLKKENVERFEKVIDEYRSYFEDEYRVNDPAIMVSCENCDALKTVMSEKAKNSIIDFILYTDTGVMRMDADFPEYVESSNSLGVVKTTDDAVVFDICPRSSKESIVKEIYDKVERLTNNIGGSMEVVYNCPVWSYRPGTKLLEVFISKYREMYNREPKLIILHASLEPGVIASKMDVKTETIAYGPNIANMHTPGESLEIQSTAKLWEFTKEVIAAL